eukprot:gene19421-19840_t
MSHARQPANIQGDQVPMAEVKSAFDWSDPFLLSDQLTEDETLILETARGFSTETLLPRIVAAY